MGIDWSRFVEIVRTEQRFLLTSHTRADCDALGSELGMADILRSLGKQVMVVNGDGVPPHLTSFDPEHRIKVLGVDVDEKTCEQVDAMMVLDTSAWIQLGSMAEVLKRTGAKKLVIDHHLSEDDFGAEYFKDTQAEATGRLVVEAADALGVELTAEMASPLLAALATDTGWFRFASVTEKTFFVAHRLVRAGARPSELYAQLYERNTLERLHLRGRILGKARRGLEGQVIFAEIGPADLAETGAEPTDTEDVVNMLLTVSGSKVAVLMLELASGKIKVSLRGRGGVDVRKIAERFGGGGHQAAAGVTFETSLEAARSSILDALREDMG